MTASEDSVMMDRIRDLRNRLRESELGGGLERITRQHKRGKMTARERLSALLDPGTFVEVDALATHRCSDFGMDDRRGPGDGVVAGHGLIDGRLVFVYAQDYTFMGGSLGEEHARKICKVMDLALKVGAPIIGLNDSGGARIQEGVEALAGYGEIFLRNVTASGAIPQITAIMGPCAGGAVYSPALTDFIIMVKGTSQMFITGPNVVKAVTGEEVTVKELGGSQVHSRLSGVADLVAEDDEECLLLIKRLLSHLPSNNLEDPPLLGMTGLEGAYPQDDVARIVPGDPKKAYDMRDVIRRIVDPDSFLELKGEYAPNALTGLARLKGISVGTVANQPLAYAGCLDINSSQKISRFVRFCDAFNLPLITFVDVPGYLPGVQQEYGGVIRHGAKVIYSYSEATVPKITVVIRKAYGGGYIAMGSKHLGSDVVLAWPTAEIAVMGPEGAVNIVFRREIGEAENPDEVRRRLIQEYREKFTNPYVAASRGYVDGVIEPKDTRINLIKAMERLRNKRILSTKPGVKHGNIPL